MKILSILAVLSVVTASIYAPSALANNQQKMDKEIQIRNVMTKDLSVLVTPAKSVYAINESIRFNVSGNKDFFLYLFSVDEKSKKATMIFPNKDHKGNKFKANHKNIIPNKTIEFYSNKQGKEKLMAFASTVYFDWNTKGYSEVGKFVQTDMNAFETQSKAFRIRARTQAAPQVAQNNSSTAQSENIHIQSLYAVIGDHTNFGQQVSSQVSGMTNSFGSQVNQMINQDPAIVFSGTDKKVYKSGEVVSILVGANKPGVLHIYTAEPNGRLVPLTTQPVNGKGFETLQAEATAPYGIHALVVAFSKNSTLKSKYLIEQYKKEALVGQSKGLRLIQKPEPISYSVTEFKIVR